MAYNTGNPLGSTDPRDLSDNSENLDRALNSDSKTWSNRLGRTRPTLRAGEIASQEVVDTAEQAKQQVNDTATTAQSNISTEVEVVRQSAQQADNDFRAEVDGLRGNIDERLNGILIAGGRIFDSEGQGRAAAGDGQYFYAAGPDNNVSRTLYERISASESRFVADDPSALFLSRVLAGASTGPKVWSYPYSEYQLTGFERLTLDQNQNILTYQLGGETISLRNSEMRSTSYPLTLYSDADGSDAVVDARGNVVSLMTVRDYFGRPCPYPYTDYASLSAYLIVDKNDFVVDVKTLTPPPSPVKDTGSLGAMYVEADATTNTIKAAWLHGSEHVLRVTYQPNGKNNLFNWRQTEIATGQDLENASWSTIQSSNSDCWPPYVVEALNDGDGASSIYTGGNHGSDGGSGGLDTAKMDSCKISIDGRELLPGKTVTGFADSICVEWVNQVMAYNTITFPRYVIEQRILMEITPGSASGFCEVQALEPIVISVDNGPQMFSRGYDTIHFYEGEKKSRLTLAEADGLSSGPFRTYPTWAAVLASPVNGFHGAWMDREYEAGDGRYLGGSIGYWRRGGGSNTKVYAAVVGTGRVEFAEGDAYEWHGGYFWSPYEFADDLDSAFIFSKRRKPTLGWSTLSSQDGKIQLPLWLRGAELDGLGVSGFSGVKFQTEGYVTSQNTVEL